MSDAPSVNVYSNPSCRLDESIRREYSQVVGFYRDKQDVIRALRGAGLEEAIIDEGVVYHGATIDQIRHAKHANGKGLEPVLLLDDLE